MPKKRRLLWKLYPSYAGVILVSLVAVTWHSTVAMRDFYHRESERELSALARLAEAYVSRQFDSLDAAAVDGLCSQIGSLISARVTVIRRDGTVLGDSDEDPGRMENHANRPEVGAALRGETGVNTRYSATLRMRMMYVAVPLTGDGAIAAVVRTSRPLIRIEATLSAIHHRILSVGAIIAVLAAIVSLMVSRHLTGPLEGMLVAAKRMALGDLVSRIPETDSEELSGLATTMNQMAVQLANRIDSLTRQRNELEAILSSTVEGVLAVDREQRIIKMNDAAASLFGLDPEGAHDTSLIESIRSSVLQDQVARALASGEATREEIVLHNGGERFIQSQAAAIRDARGESIGAVIVLHDVTQLRLLESVRREFVANVSHELRTPITSVKGFVETLLEGAMDHPEDAQRFLRIVARQVDRLQAIIEDLLLLSRLEHCPEQTPADREMRPLEGLLKSACEFCGAKAAAKGIDLHFACDPALRVYVNARLIEQAVINLIDNAINCSEPKAQVRVEAEERGQAVAIDVHDDGCGIPEVHLERIFERFYRVDRARSREAGGTGLGLAIVKHIARSHGGAVTVQSTLGVGSTFTVTLPLPSAQPDCREA